MNSPAFPPNRPSSEANLTVDRSLRSVTGGSYGDSKSLRLPGTAPATLPHAFGSTRSRQPRIDSKHGSVLCPISRRGSKIPLVGRVGGTAILTGLPDPRNRLPDRELFGTFRVGPPSLPDQPQPPADPRVQVPIHPGRRPGRWDERQEHWRAFGFGVFGRKLNRSAATSDLEKTNRQARTQCTGSNRGCGTRCQRIRW
jgi:hypothetical protein